MVDAHLLVASPVQVNVVEHAHEDDLVWKIRRRKIPLRFREDFLNLSQHVHGCVCKVDVPQESDRLSRNPIFAKEVTIFRKLICFMFKHVVSIQY